MAQVHEKPYQSGALADRSLRESTRDLLGQVDEQSGASQRQITLHAEIADRRCRLGSAIPFGLLVTERVCNAIEHGFAGRSLGRVRVRLQQHVAGVLLRISDDGIGLAPGFEPVQAASMGL